jgi:hypothetical protein
MTVQGTTFTKFLMFTQAHTAAITLSSTRTPWMCKGLISFGYELASIEGNPAVVGRSDTLLPEVLHA